jgi:hypothetical protein
MTPTPATLSVLNHKWGVFEQVGDEIVYMDLNRIKILSKKPVTNLPLTETTILIRNADETEDVFEVYVIGLSASVGTSHQYYEYTIEYILKDKESR